MCHESNKKTQLHKRYAMAKNVILFPVCARHNGWNKKPGKYWPITSKHTHKHFKQQIIHKLSQADKKANDPLNGLIILYQQQRLVC